MKKYSIMEGFFANEHMKLFCAALDVVHDPVVNANNYTLCEWLFTMEPGLFGLIGGIANPTGIALISILTIMFICSQTFVRRGGCFEVSLSLVFRSDYFKRSRSYCNNLFHKVKKWLLLGILKKIFLTYTEKDMFTNRFHLVLCQ